MKMTILPIIHNLMVRESSSNEQLLVSWGFIASTGKVACGMRRPGR